MKEIRFILCAMLLGVLAACGGGGRTLVEARTDDVGSLQSALVTVNKDGDFVSYNVGEVLWGASDAYELTVTVTDLAEAQSLFKSWLPSDAQVSASGNDLVLNARDWQGNDQGKAYLTANPGNGLVAQLTFSGFTLKYVSRVNFISD